ncbi:DUF222 domain-containing protein [Nocardioides sp. zg-579]|uniref:DUF222 domain-containing protein n=1 Tax=Nocardioides marmotae TaxID=2663857 RepID=A0A6I3JE45_9ACTN|nr:HNH endonuclease signature motif containing protein [Nocardioides marmotae]MCR6032664.1 DUF222 domain-containing protein [Gordonia jinghuaiqii]MTB96313.1 DUF222 domain-containing protein [Nocardioides marmotae]QKE03201.1 DUF222 domain-containing protein [Nocardioides marmotae]
MAKDSRHHAHTVCRAVAKSRKKTRAAATAELWSMSDEDVEATLVEASRLRAQAEALELRLVAEADRRHAGERAGATDTASWWAHRTRQERRVAKGRARLAESLDRHEPSAAALVEGAISVDHARVITACVDRLPDDLEDPTIPARAEQHLLAEAAHLDPKTLAVLAKHVLTVVAPEIGEARDARALEREEREARANAWLTMCPDGKGSVRGKFSIPELHAAMLHKTLLAFAAPKHQAATKDPEADQIDQVERRPSPERMGDAFCELLEHLPTDQLPKLGGLNATVVVTIDVDSLVGGLAPGVLDDGGVISAATARRLACEAGLIPAVLGTRSELLDLGRKTRLFSGAQRRGLNLAQPACTADGCDWPAHLCHAHHDHPWSRGGTTDLANARNLCPRHHARIHDPAYETTHLPDGKVAFHRRT